MALVFAVMHNLYKNYIYILLYFLLLPSIPFFFMLFKKSDTDKSMELSMIPASPSLMCFFKFNKGNTEGTKSLKILCLTFVYVL